MSAVKRWFFSVEPCVVFTTRHLLPATKKDVVPPHHQNNVIYQFVCHCDSRYVGCKSRRLEEQIKQHIPKSITNPPIPHIRQSLPHPGKDSSPRPFRESAIGQHLDNAQCALHYNKDKFSLELALHFTFLPWKRLSSNLWILFFANTTNLVDCSNVSTRSKLLFNQWQLALSLAEKFIKDLKGAKLNGGVQIEPSN